MLSQMVYPVFEQFKARGVEHGALVSGGGSCCVELETFSWINTMIGNVKKAIHGS
jgi:hypothetical protein